MYCGCSNCLCTDILLKAFFNAQMAAHVPGTSQHKATHDSSTATGGGGSTMQKVKEHIPGTNEHQAIHGPGGQSGMQTGYTTSGGGMGGAGAGGAGAMTGAGADQGLAGAGGGAGNPCTAMHSISDIRVLRFLPIRCWSFRNLLHRTLLFEIRWPGMDVDAVYAGSGGYSGMGGTNTGTGVGTGMGGEHHHGHHHHHHHHAGGAGEHLSYSRSSTILHKSAAATFAPTS